MEFTGGEAKEGLASGGSRASGDPQEVQWRSTISGQTSQPGPLAHWSPSEHRPLPTPTSPGPSPWGGDSRSPGKPWLRSSAHTPLCGRALHSTSPRTRCGRQGGRWFPHAPPPSPPPRPARTASHAPPPGMQEARGLPQRNVLLPSDLQGRGKKARHSLPQPCLTPSPPKRQRQPRLAPGSTGPGNQWVRAGEPGGGSLVRSPAGKQEADPQMDGQMPGGPSAGPAPAQPSPSRA